MWENACKSPAWEPYQSFFNNVKQSFLHQIVYYLLMLIHREYIYVKLSTCFTGTKQE